MNRTLALYIDESGTQRWPSRKQSANLHHFTCAVGGILADARQDEEIADFIPSFLDKLAKDVGLPTIRWLHFTDLMSRRRSFSTLSDDRVIDRAHEFVNFLITQKIRVVGARNNLWTLVDRRGRRDHPYLYTLESALIQTDLYCGKHDKRFKATVAGGNNVGDEVTRNFVSRIRSQTRIGSRGQPLSSARLGRLVDGVVIGDVRESSGLQAADAVAWMLQSEDPIWRERIRQLWLIDPAPDFGLSAALKAST